MAANLALKLTGGSSNADPNVSLGGVGSSVSVSATPMNALFDNATPSECLAGDIEYRAVDLLNTGDATATVVAAYLGTETTSDHTTVYLASEGVDPGVPISLADESDSTNQLSGLVFAAYTSGSKLSLADIPAGSRLRLWLQRRITAGASNLSNDEGVLNWEYA